jgi:hypothetical protein
MAAIKQAKGLGLSREEVYRELYDSKIANPLKFQLPEVKEDGRLDIRLQKESDNGRSVKLARALTGELWKRGFSLINDVSKQSYEELKNETQYLIEDKELVFNRAKGSSYRVFVREDLASLTVQFMDSDSSENAFSLSNKQIVGIRKLWRAKDAEKIANEILETSKRKPLDIHISQDHGHSGYLTRFDENGKPSVSEIKEDDGVGLDKDITRNMAVANIDVIMEGYHNAFITEHFVLMERLARVFGMLKVPSLELTLPLRENKFNTGPHHEIWFASPEIADEIHKKYLLPKTQPLPGIAPDNVRYDQIMPELMKYRERKELIIGLNHPACEKMIGDSGLINAVSLGVLGFDDAVKRTKQYCDRVGCFNLAVSKEELEFKNPADEEAVRKIIQEYGTGNCLSPQAINPAFAKSMEKQGLMLYFENDKHSMHPLSYKPWVGAYMRGWNEIKYDSEARGPLTGKALIVGLCDRSLMSRPVVFYKLTKNGRREYYDIIPKRSETGEEKRHDRWNSIKEKILDARDLVVGIIRKIFGKKHD